MISAIDMSMDESWTEEESEIQFRSIAKDLENVPAEVVISGFFDDDVTDEIVLDAIA